MTDYWFLVFSLGSGLYPRLLNFGGTQTQPLSFLYLSANLSGDLIQSSGIKTHVQWWLLNFYLQLVLSSEFQTTQLCKTQLCISVRFLISTSNFIWTKPNIWFTHTHAYTRTHAPLHSLQQLEPQVFYLKALESFLAPSYQSHHSNNKSYRLFGKAVLWSLSTLTWLQRMGFGPGMLPYQEITESAQPVWSHRLSCGHIFPCFKHSECSLVLLKCVYRQSSCTLLASVIFDSTGERLKSFQCSPRRVCIGSWPVLAVGGPCLL